MTLKLLLVDDEPLARSRLRTLLAEYSRIVDHMTCLAAAIVVSRITPNPAPDRPVDLADIGFGTRATFNVLAVVVTAILVGLYVFLW